MFTLLALRIFHILAASLLLLHEFGLLILRPIIINPNGLSRTSVARARSGATTTAVALVCNGCVRGRADHSWTIHALSGSGASHLTQLLLTGLRNIAELAFPAILICADTL